MSLPRTKNGLRTHALAVLDHNKEIEYRQPPGEGVIIE